MVICPPCQDGPNSVAYFNTTTKKPVYNWQLCATRVLRCWRRHAHIQRIISERQDSK